MNSDDFELLVSQALSDIPEKFRSLMENVAVTIEDEARPENEREVGIRRGEVLLGLYQGVPRTKRGPHYSMVLPDKITIFQKPIELLGQTPEGVKQLVFETVWHEVGHHFGLSDEQIKSAEKRRKGFHQHTPV